MKWIRHQRLATGGGGPAMAYTDHLPPEMRHTAGPWVVCPTRVERIIWWGDTQTATGVRWLAGEFPWPLTGLQPTTGCPME